MFTGWTATACASLSDASAANTTVTLIGSATVTATFAVKTNKLNVIDGSGSGSYEVGANVPITANQPAQGMKFKEWTGDTVNVAAPRSASTSVKMPDAPVTVAATFAQADATYTLAVVSGSGSGSYAAGAMATITADPPPSGKIFQRMDRLPGGRRLRRHHDAGDARQGRDRYGHLPGPRR